MQDAKPLSHTHITKSTRNIKYTIADTCNWCKHLCTQISIEAIEICSSNINDQHDLTQRHKNEFKLLNSSNTKENINYKQFKTTEIWKIYQQNHKKTSDLFETQADWRWNRSDSSSIMIKLSEIEPNIF